MFIDGLVEAPATDRIGRSELRAFKGFLTFDQFLEINPFSLRLCQKGRASLGTEVPNDNAR